MSFHLPIFAVTRALHYLRRSTIRSNREITEAAFDMKFKTYHGNKEYKSREHALMNYLLKHNLVTRVAIGAYALSPIERALGPARAGHAPTIPSPANNH